MGMLRNSSRRSCGRIPIWEGDLDCDVATSPPGQRNDAAFTIINDRKALSKNTLHSIQLLRLRLAVRRHRRLIQLDPVPLGPVRLQLGLQLRAHLRLGGVLLPLLLLGLQAAALLLRGGRSRPGRSGFLGALLLSLQLPLRPLLLRLLPLLLRSALRSLSVGIGFRNLDREFSEQVGHKFVVRNPSPPNFLLRYGWGKPHNQVRDGRGRVGLGLLVQSVCHPLDIGQLCNHVSSIQRGAPFLLILPQALAAASRVHSFGFVLARGVATLKPKRQNLPLLRRLPLALGFRVTPDFQGLAGPPCLRDRLRIAATRVPAPAPAPATTATAGAAASPPGGAARGLG
mmetsp:Transcript_69661/g.160086  ORF Transcript_69661/g.160086 Transcript_69661/m.160086 type:complete len:342 (-) Transcript_69661:799-1824(-)